MICFFPLHPTLWNSGVMGVYLANVINSTAKQSVKRAQVFKETVSLQNKPLKSIGDNQNVPEVSSVGLQVLLPLLKQDKV